MSAHNHQYELPPRRRGLRKREIARKLVEESMNLLFIADALLSEGTKKPTEDYYTCGIFPKGDSK